ncbi:1-aminocyclopropane-1-carboxylate synthase 7-like protein [Carex littledalei]|uniref:1-aminocyclopropane-1-carboxylate synthase 7-like protein n=1 Tax=Carex littledalei TaxID=544730 RepID=A0A833V6G0_9POAL|nr:1-aminocyclopropane-1-carboxylate synthase 7-like protein [Carex littledalei]
MVAKDYKPCVPLSAIATSSTHGEDSPYFAGWRAYDDDPYDAINNPSGVIQMGLAENQVSFDLFEKYLEEHQEVSNLVNGVASFRENALFQDYHGLNSFRKAMTSFMEEIRGGKVKFDSNRVVLTAGATAANELLTFIIANPGDALLVPTPYYPGFDRDLRWRTGVNIIPVNCYSSNKFQITKEALEDAYAKAEKANIPVKGLLITNPSNPLGTAITRPVLKEIFNFISTKNIHLISDEIYSGSVFSSEEFTSVAEMVHERGYYDAQRVHIVYSLSKDLGLPGFRVGAIYSYNDAVVTTARRMSSFTLVSSQTQKMLSPMLSDVNFTKNYIKTNRDRLKRRYEYVVERMRECGIECLQGNAGLFCWMNLKPLLEEATIEGELKLWDMILKDLKLDISPGSSCHCTEPGWFRVCFAKMNIETLDVALARLTSFMEKRKKT